MTSRRIQLAKALPSNSESQCSIRVLTETKGLNVRSIFMPSDATLLRMPTPTSFKIFSNHCFISMHHTSLSLSPS